MSLDQGGQARNRSRGDARSRSLRQLTASQRIEHPSWHRQTGTIGQPHQIDDLLEPTEHSNDLHLRAIEWVMTIFDLLQISFMSSIGIPLRARVLPNSHCIFTAEGITKSRQRLCIAQDSAFRAAGSDVSLVARCGDQKAPRTRRQDCRATTRV